MNKRWHPVTSVLPNSKTFQRDTDDGGHLTVILSIDDGDWHMSISHRDSNLRPGRYPTWNEIVDARYLFCPQDKNMAMLLPPREEYVNIHETTFHLWEVKGVLKQ